MIFETELGNWIVKIDGVVRGHFVNTLDFVRESNRIEGIRREPTLEEIRAHDKLVHNNRGNGMEPAKSMYISMDDLEKARRDYSLGKEARKRGEGKELKPEHCGNEWYWGWEDGA